jgi:hypothetical protein
VQQRRLVHRHWHFGADCRTTNESITGTLNSDGTVTFKATYLPGGIYLGYTWGVTNAKFGAQVNYWDAWGQELPTVSTLTNIQFTDLTHGQYVSQGGDPHSCIGMPIQSQS